MIENNNSADMDSLLDGTLDDLADAPSFKPFAAGAHMLKINWVTDQPINNIPTVKAKLTHVSTEELANAEDIAPTPGDETEVAYMLKNKEGKANELAQGQLKELLASIKSGLNLPEGTSNREVMGASEGMELLVVTTVRVDKRDPADKKYYTAIKSASVV